jgi:hypothetical protein
MKKTLLMYVMVGVLSLQLVCGSTVANAATLETHLTVAAPSMNTTQLTQLIAALQSILALLQQKISQSQPATAIAGQQNLQAIIVATTTKAKGWVESVTPDGVITGWAIDTAASNTPTIVGIYVDGVRVGTTSTYLYRSDVNLSQKVTGKHGFIFALSTTTKADGVSHHVDVTLVRTGASLNLGKTVPLNKFLPYHQL